MAFLVEHQVVQRALAQGSILLGTMIRGMTAGSRVFEVIKFSCLERLTVIIFCVC